VVYRSVASREKTIESNLVPSGQAREDPLNALASEADALGETPR
jgi:hypothetical protein